MMKYALTQLASKADFTWWPLRSTTGFSLLLLILIVIIGVNVKEVIHVKRHHLLRPVNRAYGFAIFATALLLILGVINLVRINHNITLASRMADNLSLAKDGQLLVVPNYLEPSAKQFLVVDNDHTIAVIDKTGYHSKSQQGDALYRLSQQVYQVRHKLVVKRAFRQSNDNRTIQRSGKAYIAMVSPGDNNTYYYTSYFNGRFAKKQSF